MFKNFIPSVRESLYNNKKNKHNGTESGDIASKNENDKFEEYKSENVFASNQNINGRSSKTIPNKISTRKLVKKLRKTSSNDFISNREEIKQAGNRKKIKKHSDLVNNTNNLSPSRSEMHKEKEMKIKKRSLPRRMPINTQNIQSHASLITLPCVSNSEGPKVPRVLKRRKSLSARSVDHESSMDCSSIKSSNRNNSNSLMDIDSFQIEDISNSDDFNWEELLALDTDSTISVKRSPKKTKKIKKRIKRKVRKLSMLESDDSDSCLNLEQWSNEADFGTITNEHTDSECRFITKKLKGVRIESVAVVDVLEHHNHKDENVETKLNDVPITLTTSNTVLEEQNIITQPEITLEDIPVNIENLNDTLSPEIDTSLTTLTETSNKPTNTKYLAVVSKRVVILKKGESIPVFGIFTLNVLYGKLEVLGYILHRHSQEANIYSPRGSALLYLRNASNGKEEGFEEMKTSDWFGKYKLQESDVVVECIILQDFKISFIEKYISHQIFPKMYTRAPRVIFEPKDLSAITVSPTWNELIDSITSVTKVMVTGGKGVGKSVFLRYTVNRLLCTFDRVRVIDLDPGQSEFTLPGGISVITVEQPSFGPNYTHLKKSERSYLCGIDIGHNPKYYIYCIKELMEYVSTLECIPTIINYMGFVKGLGVNIVSSAITFIKPTDVVQINSAKKKNNFVTDLSMQTVMQNCELFGKDRIDFEYSLHVLNAMTDRNCGWTLEPRQMRELCVLSYLGEMMTDSTVALTSHKLPMYKIQLKDVKITDIQGADLHPSAVNANLVALCTKSHNIFNCLGFGVVRGVDLDKKYLVLLTPEDPDVLNDVEYLVLTRVSLPPAVYMSPQDVDGSIPYVMDGELVSLAQITRRSYLPVNKK